MKIFFAGSQGFEQTQTNLLEFIKTRLLSYHYMTPSLDKFYMSERPPESKIENLIMDSGAFSAWNKGSKIDLNAYIDYCLRYEEKITYIVNLDVIPGTPGQKAISRKQVEKSATLGYRNLQKMISEGVPREKLIPVFHQNEHFEWLSRMVDEFDYIGLSPANDRTTFEKIQWLDQCMPFVTDKEGYPIVRFHGFAVTSHILLKRFPWYSVDSATWCQEAGWGRVFVPSFKNGCYNYKDAPILIRIGFNSPREVKKDHFFNMPPIQKKIITDYFESRKYILGESSCSKFTAQSKRNGKAFIRFCREKPDCDNRIPDAGCIEEMSEIGIINNHAIRAELNVLLVNDMAEAFGSWSSKRYTHQRTAQGFNL